MQIKSLVSIVSKLETVKSRRLAVKKSWSDQEKDERRRLAVASQLRLASLIAKIGTKVIPAEDLEELAACG